MKKEVILVPKDKCPLEILAEMGERIKNSWIFLHENAYKHLLKSEGIHYSTDTCMNANQSTWMHWPATKEDSKKVVFCDVPQPKGWGKITSIFAENICFERSPLDPENIFFLKMAK